jgi:hypothetical protein
LKINSNITYIFLLFTTIIGGCKEEPPVDDVPTLIIQSGFEPDVNLYVYNSEIYGIQGVDNSAVPPNNWSLANEDPRIGDFYFQMGAPGTLADRNIFITSDPLNPLNNVLAFEINNATEFGPPMKGRVSCNIGENNYLKEIYYKVKMFIPADIGYLSDYSFTSGNWLTLMEFWNNPDWTSPATYPFRITLYVVNSPDSSHLNFAVEAQTMDPGNWQSVWSIANNSFNLPFNEWLEMEVYYKEGDNASGRFYMTVTQASMVKTVLFDVTNYTHHPNDTSPTGLKYINPMKMYCSQNVLEWVKNHQPVNGTFKMYWDDFEFWKNKNPF